MSDVLHTQFVDVGGRRLAVKVLGQGKPAVVLEMGMAGKSQMFDHIAPKIAEWTQVIWYDRGGLGQSDPAPEPRTFQDCVEDLYTLLQRLSIAGPYILVGHSMGGELVRLYATSHQKDVAALVLIDAAHETQIERLLAILPPVQPDEHPQLTHMRLYLSEQWKQLDNDERIDFVTSFEQMRICSSLGNLPLVVITRGRVPTSDDGRLQEVLDAGERVWRQLQCEQADLSTQSQHVIAEKSGHLVNQDEPEIIVEEIQKLISFLRELPEKS